MVPVSKHAILDISCFSFWVFQINMQPILGLQPCLVLTMVAIHDNGAQANSEKVTGTKGLDFIEYHQWWKISLPLRKNWQHDLFTIPSKNISGCSLKHWTPAALASTHYYITDMIQNWGNHHLHQHLEDSNHALCSLEFNRLSDPPHITAIGPGFTSTSAGNKILL